MRWLIVLRSVSVARNAWSVGYPSILVAVMLQRQRQTPTAATTVRGLNKSHGPGISGPVNCNA